MLTLAQIKQALKIDYTADDQELLRLKDAVESLVSEYTGLTLCQTNVVQYLGYFMKTRFDHNPVLSVSSVKYTNTQGNEVTMDPEGWFLIYSELPSVYINFREFPSVKDGTEIQVSYKVGYAQYPPVLQQAVISLIGHYYNNPESASPVSLSEVPLSTKWILDTMKVKGSLS